MEVRSAPVDLTGTQVGATVASLTEDIEVGLLVYNAGATHSVGLFHDDPLAKAEALVSLNCLSPLLLCHTLGGHMRRRGRGGIILLSSLSGLTGGGYIATYAATKAFDISLAEGLWAELKPNGVDVLALIAGATDTPAMANSGANFAAWTATPLTSQDVAREGLQQLGHGPIWIAGASNRAFAGVLRGEDRQPAIEAMTAGSAMLYDRPFPIEPTGGGE